MAPGVQVGLGLGHIVLDGDACSSPLQKTGGTAQPPICGPSLLWPNSGCIRMPLDMEVGSAAQATLS